MRISFREMNEILYKTYKGKEYNIRMKYPDTLKEYDWTKEEYDAAYDHWSRTGEDC